MNICEAWGMTENCAYSIINFPFNPNKIGSVGRAIEGCQVRRTEQGELMVKSPGLMKGYYLEPEKTAEVIKNGYFHTGDKGEFDADGFLKITGRTKEMFKTSGGKYIVPPLLEGELKQSLFIEQVMVVGEGEKMPAAIIQPNFEFIQEWIDRKKKNGILTLYL